MFVKSDITSREAKISVLSNNFSESLLYNSKLLFTWLLVLEMLINMIFCKKEKRSLQYVDVKRGGVFYHRL